MEFTGPDGITKTTAPTDQGSALLLGLPPEAPVTATVVAGLVRSEPVSITTGSAPSDLVGFTVGGDLATFEGHLVLAVLDRAAVVIVDAEGRPVWWHEGVAGFTATRGLASADGTGVWLNQEVLQDGDDADSHLLHVNWWGDVQTPVTWPRVKHDFLEHTDGTLAALTDVLADPDEPTTRAGGLVERAPDGTERVVWSIHDDPAVCDAQGELLSHPNALDWDPASERYLISLHVRQCIVAIDRGTGQLAWWLGGTGGDFLLSPDSTPFGPQHQFSLTPTGIVLFDNGAPSDNASRAVAYDLDFDAWTADETWSVPYEPAFYAAAYGDVEALGSGLTRVIWDGRGHVQHLDEDGDAVWELRTADGEGLAYGSSLTDLASRSR